MCLPLHMGGVPSYMETADTFKQEVVRGRETASTGTPRHLQVAAAEAGSCSTLSSLSTPMALEQQPAQWVWAQLSRARERVWLPGNQLGQSTYIGVAPQPVFRPGPAPNWPWRRAGRFKKIFHWSCPLSNAISPSYGPWTPGPHTHWQSRGRTHLYWDHEYKGSGRKAKSIDIKSSTRRQGWPGKTWMSGNVGDRTG